MRGCREAMTRRALLLLLLVAAASTAAATATRPPPPTVADFIIVGGGTAGCALAARLCAALPAARVVLLERGVPRNATEELLVRAMRLNTAAWPVPSLTETLVGAPSPGAGGRRQTLYTGASLGGTSLINVAQWSVPVGDDPVGPWGVTGFNASTARRYYDRAARTLGAARPPRRLWQDYTDEWLAAAGRAGLPTVDDAAPVGQQPRRGVWVHRLAADAGGRRVDACSAYVVPALAGACAANLDVRQGVTVTRVLLSRRRRRRGRRPGSHRRPVAVGVEYVVSGYRGGPRGRRQPRYTLRATRAVIAAAGPYGSPTLLLRSGIGPAAASRAAGIPVAADLPVGVRMQTRPIGAVAAVYAGVPLAAVNNGTLLNSPATLAAWRAGRGGVLGMSVAAGLGRVPDDAGAYLGAAFATLQGPPGRRDFATACLGNPASTGSLSLPVGAADPTAPPVVAPNLLGDARDVATLVACMRTLQAVVRAFPPAFRMRQVAPAAGAAVDDAFVRATALSAQHMVGGCAVGGVLGGGLGVRGVGRLHVVDASAIPTMPRSAGPMASVYALAEFAAERLARRYGGGMTAAGDGR